MVVTLLGILTAASHCQILYSILSDSWQILLDFKLKGLIAEMSDPLRKKDKYETTSEIFE
jgi:hypothetical protein